MPSGRSGTSSRTARAASAPASRSDDGQARKERTMSLETLALGEALPVHHARAKMPAEATENKIHEDGIAREFGFRGALVPGVTVYAWMTNPVVAALGTAWLERGTFQARFASPVYFDEPIRIE